MPNEILALARKCGAHVENWLTNPPKVGRVTFTTAQLRSFVEAIREKDAQDAKRYRWLRNNAVYFGWLDEEEGRPSPWCVLGIDAVENEPCEGIELDQEVDAAIRQASTEGGGK